MQIRQLFDSDTSTFTYLLWDEQTRESAIIDSVREQFERDSTLIDELGLTLKYALETHIHADHITASGLLRQRFGAVIALHKNSQASCADELLIDNQILYLGNQTIEVIATPGHTNTDVSYKINGAVFTGDALMIRACGRTDFQSGDSRQLYHSITQKIFKLPAETAVYPGHDYNGRTASTIEEERAYNPYFTGVNEAAFIQKMANLNLPQPKRIDIAVPGNEVCGLELERSA
ncbi:MBL fold metallo-hydrolase [Ectothiorhodospiraceae bacterium BW-2]|nr:MBL fold metallo-hydrolase [Ectothiorhodospiraceae bacterium BW-2]